MVKYRIALTEAERTELRGLLGKGRHAARKLTRARILLMSDEGRSEREIASALSVGVRTVERIRRRGAEAGVVAALVDRPRPGARLKLGERAQARLIAEACCTPGDGHARWTLKLLAGRVVELGLAKSMAPETVRSYLKKTNSSPGRSKSGVCPR
jgi:transposase